MYPGVVCVLPLLIALRPKLRELQCVLIAATSPSCTYTCTFNVRYKSCFQFSEIAVIVSTRILTMYSVSQM